MPAQSSELCSVARRQIPGDSARGPRSREEEELCDPLGLMKSLSPGARAEAALARSPRPPLPIIAAHPLERRIAPFDDSEWLFEAKADGFSGMLCMAGGAGCFVSRNLLDHLIGLREHRLR